MFFPHTISFVSFSFSWVVKRIVKRGIGGSSRDIVRKKNEIGIVCGVFFGVRLRVCIRYQSLPMRPKEQGKVE
jgi:hypothetical protein